MSKINQIQNKLLELGDGAFQKLADSDLLKKGYTQVNPIGSVIGSDKVRSRTPDTLIPLSNDRYLFAEHTTQQTGVFRKFTEDLEKCFDEQKTGISIDKIQEIVLCHTTEFSPDERTLLEDSMRNTTLFSMYLGSGVFRTIYWKSFPVSQKGT